VGPAGKDGTQGPPGPMPVMSPTSLAFASCVQTTSKCVAQEWPCAKPFPTPPATFVANLTTYSTDIINKIVIPIVVNEINAILYPNGQALPVPEALASLNKSLDSGLPTIKTKLRTNLINGSNDQGIIALVNNILDTGMPFVINGINDIIQPNGTPLQPDDAITNLKSSLNSGLTCLNSNLVNEINMCNYQNVHAPLIRANLAQCP
jgi:hypothetical protein